MSDENTNTEYQSYLHSTLELSYAIAGFEQLLNVIGEENDIHPLLYVHMNAIKSAHNSLLSRFDHKFEKVYRFIHCDSQDAIQGDFTPFQVILGDRSVSPAETL